MHVLASSYEGNRQQFGWLYMNEFGVNREKYEEFVRIRKGSSNVRIGSNELQSTHQMRCSKGGQIKGLPLLDTDDPESSPYRIYTGSAVKSLPLAD